jgi:pimeloyl-ACP methyl ester carboxylesterase
MKIRNTFVLLGCLFLSGAAFSQTAVSYKELAADFYDADESLAVILLHGTLAHNRMEIIKTIATLLSEDYGYPVLTPNLSLNNKDRMGDSIQKSTKGYAALTACDIDHTHKYGDALTELGVWVEYLKDQGFEKILVAGHSRGGRQVSAYLAKEPLDPSIAGGVLIASGLSRNERNIENYKKDTGLDLRALLDQFSKLPPDQFVDVPKFIYCEKPRVTAGAFISEYKDDPTHSAPTNVAKIRDIPVLVIGGSEDKVVPNIESDFESLSGQQNLMVEVIDGADHFFRDLYADDAVTLIVELIESL